MLRRLNSLRDRYVLANMRLAGDVSCTADDQCIISKAEWHIGRLSLTGRMTTGGRLDLGLGGMADTIDLPDNGGDFSLSLPWPVDIALHLNTANLDLNGATIANISFGKAQVERRRHEWRLYRDLVSLSPSILCWYLTRKPKYRAIIKRRLMLETQTATDVIGADLFATNSAAVPLVPDAPVTLILPVYDAADLLADCLDRIARNTELPWRIIIIDDGSPDPAIRPMLKAWARTQGDHRCTLVLRDTNEGFIFSVNEALSLWRDLPDAGQSPVVLLNSDAMLPPDWATRLLHPLMADTTVASVTPMSNDAEIFSVPAICARQTLTPAQGDAIDRIAQLLNPARSVATAPTGVGFCMTMCPTFLKQVPSFDRRFGRGYGEEVDWCQKTRALGGRHVGIGRLFVTHNGGSSFGSEEKRRLIQHNNAEISRRYPRFDLHVQQFIATDPLNGPRLVLAMAWAASLPAGADPIPVYLAHSMGGGAEHWLAQRIDARSSAGQVSTVLRVGGEARWQLSVHGPAGVTTGQFGDGNFATLKAILDLLPAREIVYSCGVGDTDPVGLPGHLLGLKRGAQDRIAVMLHDYFPISASFTLLDDALRYHGPPTPSSNDSGPLQTWQSEWHRLLKAADDITAFSKASADILCAVWPDLSPKISIRPHNLSVAPIPVTPACTTGGRLGVLGNLAPHKGAALVAALARMPTDMRGAEMILIGNIDPGYTLPESTLQHGTYRPEDIAKLASYYRITHWLIPSVWPETFSFTTHEALGTGLPVLAFDIGAQGDAVRAAPNGLALPYAPDSDLARTVAEALHKLRNTP